MKIVDKTTKVVIFEKIGFYETFMHGGEPYMKIDDCYVGTDRIPKNAVCLSGKCLTLFSLSAPVTPVNAEIVLTGAHDLESFRVGSESTETKGPERQKLICNKDDSWDL